jgi:hypothetical protein
MNKRVIINQKYYIGKKGMEARMRELEIENSLLRQKLEMVAGIVGGHGKIPIDYAPSGTKAFSTPPSTEEEVPIQRRTTSTSKPVIQPN